MSNSWSKKKDKEFEDLIKKIRRHPKYKAWREKVLSREYGNNHKLKKKKVIHHDYEISKILRDYQINSVAKALKCKALWDIDNGVVLKAGEHFILTRLRRYKYLTKGFYNFIQVWLKTCEVEKSSK